MLTRGTTFARYSRSLCWVISIIWLTLSALSFTSESESGMINGFLWLAGAVAFAISALALGREDEEGKPSGE